jgi:hypothetical protein
MVAKVSNVRIEIDSETSRIRAALVNSGKYSFTEAEGKIIDSRLHCHIGAAAARTPAGQSAFLTAVLTGVRCFGEVTYDGHCGEGLLRSLPIPAATLAEAATLFGAHNATGSARSGTVFIGSSQEPARDWSVQAFWNGWTAGIAPGRNQVEAGRSDCTLAGIAAGALAVGQAFLAEQGDCRSGRNVRSVSLWNPELRVHSADQAGPLFCQVYLPTRLWLIGLGNLGQSYLWSLAMLHYPVPEDVLLFLQDDEVIGRENWGTSVLVQRGKYNILKTRVAEEWATRCGFQVRRIDRRLDENLLRSDTEPGVALAGLDRMPVRRLLGSRGFEYIIDAGLGATVDDYCKLRVNVFDSERSPATHFEGVEDQNVLVAERLKQMPAYQELARSPGDAGCGAAMLAERSVAVPFVSAVAGALAITQAIRIASGCAHHVGITGDLRDLTSIRGTLGRRSDRVTVPSTLAAA